MDTPLNHEASPLQSDPKKPAPTKLPTGQARSLKSLARPAALGFYGAVLVALVIAGYVWGTNVSTASTNTSDLASGWVVALSVTALLAGLTVSLGLPLIWTRTESFIKTIEIVCFEALFLLVALLISGYVLFHATAPNTTTPIILPGGGCGPARALYCPEN